MENSYTVIVVGGGPAGSCAAYTLAKQGIRVCLVDKAVFPREKLCGGLLTLRSKKIFQTVFNSDWNKARNYLSNGIQFRTRDAYLCGTEAYSELSFTNRISFDDYLLRMAREAGAVILEGEGLTSLDPVLKKCTLRSGQTLIYEYLIGADGVNSTVAKTLFGASFDKDKIGFALEVEVDRELVKREVTIPEVYFDSVRWGYGWVFPKEKTLTIGVGGIHQLNPEMKADMERFHTEVTGNAPITKIKGHYIPFGDYRKTPGKGDVLLVGDAAGLVEGITGEGIAYAMQSGYLAATAIIENHSGGNDSSRVLRLYRKKIKGIQRDIRYSKIMRYLIFPERSQQLFFRILPSTGSLVHKQLDLMADEITYPQFLGFIVRKITARMFRGLTGKGRNN